MSSPEFQAWWANFRVTGDICPVRLGITRDELKAILGEPDDVSTTSRKHRTPAIFKYEELEFHFEPEPDGRLSLIYMEVDNVPTISISVIYAKELKR